MRTVPAPGLPTIRLATLAAVLVCATGCGEGDVRPVQTCTPEADWTDRTQPFHTITIDNANDFDRAHEQFAVSTDSARSGYAAYATWDACTLYLGFEGAALGPGTCDPDDADCAPVDVGASAHRYLTVYFNTDPLGDDGVDDPKDYGVPRPKLPFHAEYLFELRTDGRTEYEDGEARYHGNVQFYHARSDWGAGLMQEWKPLQPEGLTIGHGPAEGFVEVAVPLSLIGDPCAVELTGWVVDEQTDSGFGYWPPPLHQASPKAAHAGRSGLALADTLALDYWGFMLIDGQTPKASANLNRTRYDEVGECAYGVVHDA